jgi:hypothetical protein
MLDRLGGVVWIESSGGGAVCFARRGAGSRQALGFGVEGGSFALQGAWVDVLGVRGRGGRGGALGGIGGELGAEFGVEFVFCCDGRGVFDVFAAGFPPIMGVGKRLFPFFEPGAEVEGLYM